MALSYSDVAHLQDLVRRVRELEEREARRAGLAEGRDWAGEIQALKMRLGGLQAQINALRGGRLPEPQPEGPVENTDAA